MQELQVCYQSTEHESYRRQSEVQEMQQQSAQAIKEEIKRY